MKTGASALSISASSYLFDSINSMGDINGPANNNDHHAGDNDNNRRRNPSNTAHRAYCGKSRCEGSRNSFAYRRCTPSDTNTSNRSGSM